MRTVVLSIASVLAAACAGEPPPSSVPTSTMSFTVTGGDGQHGTPGQALPAPVSVRLVDRDGVPVQGRVVTLTPSTGHGKAAPAILATGPDGIATFTWTLGTMTGRQTMQVRSNGARQLTLVAFAVPAECPPGGCSPGGLTGAEPFRLLTVATYDGSGEAVHPDLLPGWRLGDPFLLAYTPYPGGDALHENPSIATSLDAMTWRAPTGVTNPLAVSIGGHLSDPDIVREPDGTALSLYYREVIAGRNRIHRVRSEDGRQWTPPQLVLDVPSHQALSPAVVTQAPHARWQMWTVDAGVAGCVARSVRIDRRTSADGVAWSAPATVALHQPGQVIWHLDVQWLPDRAEYWALYNTYPVGGTCTTQAIFLARSADGVTWERASAPLLTTDDVPPFRDVLYRGTFRRSADGAWLELILSGARLETNYRWRIGRVVIGTTDLFTTGPRRGVDGRWARPPAVPLPPPEPHDMPAQ
jgi:hypothetical protein